MPATSDPLLPAQNAFALTQFSGAPGARELERVEHLLVAVPEKPATTVWKQFPEGSRIKMLRGKRRGGAVTTSRLHNAAGTGVSAGSIAGSATGKRLPESYVLLRAAGKLAAAAMADNPASVAIHAAGFDDALAERVITALLLALRAHSWDAPSYAGKAPEAKRLRSVKVYGLPGDINLNRALVEGDALNLARWLTTLPPNKLDMAGYRSAVETLGKARGWQCEVLDEKKLTRRGAGAFLAVAQGNGSPGAGIMHIRYRPAGTSRKAPPLVALVGKGIIFDTGGTNLKPFKAMLDMHHDMAGSAVALATLDALTALEYQHPVDCWLAITENRIGNTAYKSRDVVTASDGTTIEVIHTDAEGRMALADTLALAGKAGPAAIIDFATLTGTCVAAVTDRYSGVFSNRDHLHNTLIAAGRACGERVWPFPMDEDFDDDLKSNVADILQCAAAGGGDHIQAARFLQRFVPAASNWVHLDLSAATRKGGLAQVPGEVTGFGVRYALQLLLDEPAALTRTDH